MRDLVRKVQPGADLVETLNRLLPGAWYARGKTPAKQRFEGLRIMQVIYDPDMKQFGYRVGGARIRCRKTNSRVVQKFILTFDYRNNAFRLKKDA
ncbi:MAG: hypothetical protein ACOYU7_08855 [Bacillota bacterium]|uniref:hypothetical protein n=1 Tax=unclassified Candidatus Desulforudis TaxID=2635950 RepID=UPI003BED3D65